MVYIYLIVFNIVICAIHAIFPFCSAQNSLKGHTNLVKLLIEHNADVNARLNDGKTPLHLATIAGLSSDLHSFPFPFQLIYEMIEVLKLGCKHSHKHLI